jgi:hypothetical protein
MNRDDRKVYIDAQRNYFRYECILKELQQWYYDKLKQVFTTEEMKENVKR